MFDSNPKADSEISSPHYVLCEDEEAEKIIMKEKNLKKFFEALKDSSGCSFIDDMSKVYNDDKDA